MRACGDELMAPSHGLLDLTVYGRQEVLEDSAEGWPQRRVQEPKPRRPEATSGDRGIV
jgi:hypothetical protein